MIGFVVSHGNSALQRIEAATVHIDVELANGGLRHASGLVVSSTGTVLTVYHAISGASRISVTLHGGARRVVAVAGYDVNDDIALLQVEGMSGLASADLELQAPPSRGASVTVVSAAGGATLSEVQGTEGSSAQMIDVIAAGDGGVTHMSGMIGIAATVAAADAGAAIVEASGSLVGMLVADPGRVVPAGGSGSAYAVSAQRMASITHDIEVNAADPDVFRGRGVVTGAAVDDRASPNGAFVVAVIPATPAQAVGIVAGDLIVSIDGARVDTDATLRGLLNAHHPGDRITIGWLAADGSRHAATLQLVSGTPT